MSAIKRTHYISVDIETAGPNPSDYSLLAIGACDVEDIDQSFYIELQPAHQQMTDESFTVHGLSLATLMQRGLPPKEGMARFATWIGETTPSGKRPVLVALNAPFDWMFVNDYFHHYLGHNPFGHAALDLKAFFMGVSKLPWEKTNLEEMSNRYLHGRVLSHHALQDAIDQAEIFRGLLTEHQE
jgi:DNA polymerase III epsilon subunit-like protein